MSKFCQNCGKPLDDAMRFCDGCGAPQQAAPQQVAPQQPQYQQPQYQQPQYQQPQYQQPPVATAPKAPKAPAKSFDFNKAVDQVKLFANGLVNRCKADKKFMYSCIGVAAAALVVLIVLLALVFGGGGMTAPIDNLIAISFKGKVEKIKDMAPSEYWEYMEDEYDMDIDDMIDDAEDSVEDMLDYYEDEYGDNIRVTYKVEKKKKLSDKKLEGIAEALADAYDLDEDKFTEAYELDIEMTIKGSEDDDDDEAEFTVIKYKGKWYAINWSKSGDEYRAYFVLGD